MFHVIIEVNCTPQMQRQTNPQQTQLQQHIAFMNYCRSIYEVRQMLLKEQEKEHTMLKT